MKVYIVTEYIDNIIRFATLRKDIAIEITNEFPHLDLKIIEKDLLGLDK